MISRLLMYVGFLFVFQGCSGTFNTVGDSKFDCNRKQDAKSPNCRSFRAMEASTSGELPESRFDKKFDLRDSDRRLGIAPDEVTDNAVKAMLPHQIGVNQVQEKLDGIPVRMAPVIQRIWIKRFVDGNDSLTEDLIVYKEIQPTRWAGFDKSIDETRPRPGAYPHKLNGTDKSGGSMTSPGVPVTQKNSFTTPGDSMVMEPTKSGSNLPN